METVLLFVIATVIAVFFYYLQNKNFTDRVNRIPGPAALPFVGNIATLWEYDFDTIKLVADLGKKYNNIFRLWIGTEPMVFLGKPADVEIILSSTKHIEKGRDYENVHDWIGLGLLTSTGQQWHTRRKLITPTFHFKVLEDFVSVFEKNAEILINNVLAKKGTLDINHYMSLCTLDIICETAMGTKVNAQMQSESSYVNAVNKASVAIFFRTMKVWLRPTLLFKLSPTGRTFYDAVKTLHKQTNDVITARKIERSTAQQKPSNTNTDDDLIGLKKKTAFLDQLLDSGKLNDKDIQEEVDTFMFEGHDTTSAAITFALYEVAKNPHVQQQIAEEMEELFGDDPRDATIHDLQKMNYTERVIKETLRLYPSVPIFLRNLREDLELTDGNVAPAGSQIVIGCFYMGRNSEYWPEPEKFDPDRFLPENCVGRHPFAIVPFSAGPRNCIGQKFAMLEMKSTISRVVRRCKLSLPSSDYKPAIKGQVVLKTPEGVFLNFEPRQ